MSDTPPFIVAIPARYGSTRLPGKPLRLIAGIPMIVHVAQRAFEAGAAQVVIATDDRRIADALRDHPVLVCMTRPEHASGTDRLAECADLLGWPDDALVVNLQGDEPLAPASGIRSVAATLHASAAPMATLATPLVDVEELFNPHCVKLVCDTQGHAIYFSRAPVPWPRDAFATHRERLPADVPFLRHIGIYAYRAGFLRQFSRLPRGRLEGVECLEQLRALEYSHRIAVRLAPETFPAGVDTPEDLARAEAWFAEAHA